MSSPEPPVRAGRPIDTAKQQAILDAAAQAFFNHGYSAASIEGIAAAAGVSKVTVYKHFAGKPALFAAAVERECAGMRRLLDFAEEGGPIEVRLLTFAQAMHDFLTQPKIIQFDRRIAAETERDPEPGRMFLDAGPKRLLRALAEMLARADRRGELRVEDPLLAAEQLSGMIKGAAHMEHRFGGEVDEARARRRVEAAVALFMRGYGPAAPDPRGRTA